MDQAYRRGEGARKPALAGAAGALLAGLAVAGLPVVLSLLLRLPFLSAPLERDEGEYAYIAWHMSQGEVPYAGAFDQKPPGVFAAYRLAFALFGWGIEAPRLLLAIWGAAAVAAAALLGRRYAGPRAGLAAGVAFALLTTSPTLWATAANTELFMLLPLLGALALAFPGGGERVAGRRGRLAGVGAMLAAAFLFKQVAAFAGLALLPFLVVGRPGPARGREGAGLEAGNGLDASPPQRFALLGWRPLAAVVAGGLAVLLPVVAAFAAAAALRPFLDSVLLHNLRYAGSCGGGSMEVLRYILGRIALSFWPVLALATVGLVAGLRERPPVWRFMALWLAAAVASAGLGCRFFPHYFLAAAPPLALLAGLGAERLAGWVERSVARRAAGSAGQEDSSSEKSSARRAGRLATALALVLTVAVPFARASPLLFGLTPGARSHAIYGPEIFPGAAALGEHIRARTRPGDAVFVLGSEPEVLFHAARRSATRYIFLDPLLGPYADARARQREAIAEVRRADPAAVVFVRHAYSLGAAPGDDVPLIQATRELLSHGYALDGALFLVPEGTALALGPAELAALPPGALRRAAALLYLRESTSDVER